MAKTPIKVQNGHRGRFALACLAPGPERILAAYSDAAAHGLRYAQSALLCGQLLNEQREAIGHGDWEVWCTKHLPEIPERTRRRWMEVAQIVADHINANAGPIVDIEAEAVPLSKLIASPAAEIPTAGLEWRQAWFDFTDNRSIGDILAGVADGERPVHALKRAAGGAAGGYHGEDRRDFPLFLARALSLASAHLAHLDSMEPARRAEVTQLLDAWACGGSVHLRGRPAGKAQWAFSPLPDAAWETLRAALHHAKRATP